MSKVIKAALIVAVAAIAIGAKQFTPADAVPAAAPSVSPMELMLKAGPLPQTEVENYF